MTSASDLAANELAPIAEFLAQTLPFNELSAEQLERATRWYTRYGVWSLLLAWVPFVDWFVVGESRQDCTVLPPDLLAATALERETIDPGVVAELSSILDQGDLSPMWFKGVPAAWERGFEPSRDVTTPR